MAALCMAILVERGYLNYEEKVSYYWPEFAQHGKENVTVRMLLNHEVNIETKEGVTTGCFLAIDHGELLSSNFSTL